MGGRDPVYAALERLETEADLLGGLPLDALSEPDCLEVMTRLMTVARRVPGVHYELANQLRERAVACDIGGPLARVIADRLLIRPVAARRMIREAEQLGHRRAMTGERLDPLWPTVAAQVQAGRIGTEHVAVIGEFFHQMPIGVDVAQRECAERMLGEMAADLRPDQLQQAADHLAARINPDGVFSDVDRARQRGFRWGRQGSDGMSQGTLVADPQLRATLDAVIAKLGAPGMCNPDDPAPTVDGTPAEDAVRRDTRSNAQRAHDALHSDGSRRVGLQERWASIAVCRPQSSCVPPCKSWNLGRARPKPAGVHGCRCAMRSRWPARRFTTLQCSTSTLTGRCIWAGPASIRRSAHRAVCA